MVCQGYPKSAVTQQYIQLDPTRPPIPIEDPELELVFMYEDELAEYEKSKHSGLPWMGLFRPLFRALGWMGRSDDETSLQTEDSPEPVPIGKLASKQVANRKRSRGLFEE
jgi:hypothetical protein